MTKNRFLLAFILVFSLVACTSGASAYKKKRKKPKNKKKCDCPSFGTLQNTSTENSYLLS